MIANEDELRVTQQRISQFQRRLLELRKVARPEEFLAVVSSYRLELERMQAEVVEYLVRPIPVGKEHQAA